MRGARDAVHRRGGVPHDVRHGRRAAAAVRLRIPPPERPAMRGAGGGHREDELARRSGVVRAVRRGGQRRARRARRRLAAGRRRAAHADGAGDGGRGDRLLGRAQHLHARAAGGDHPRAVARDPRAVVGTEGAGRSARGDRVMRAAFMTAVNAIDVRSDVPEPDVPADGAVLRVEACGICGTDARTFFNGDPKAPPPWQLGHEPVGTLDGVGPDASLPDGIGRGDRVFLGSILTCGVCRWCMEGFQNLCEDHLLYGYDPFPGAYAEYAVVPAIAMKNLIALPPELPSDLATVADPFACALNGIEQLDIRTGDTVVILGTGPIGCWQAVMARDRGPSTVFMTDVSGERLKIAIDAIEETINDDWVTGDDDSVHDVPDG